MNASEVQKSETKQTIVKGTSTEVGVILKGGKASSIISVFMKWLDQNIDKTTANYRYLVQFWKFELADSLGSNVKTVTYEYLGDSLIEIDDNPSWSPI